MTLKDPEIIDTLSANEIKLSQLYQAYSVAYKECQNFWLDMAADELTHAEWIRQLSASFQKGSLLVNDKFSTQAVKLFGDYLDQRLAGIKTEELPLERALNVALDIEQALIEKGWFNCFEPSELKDKIIIEHLIDALAMHKEKVSKMISEYKKNL